MDPGGSISAVIDSQRPIGMDYRCEDMDGVKHGNFIFQPCHFDGVRDRPSLSLSAGSWRSNTKTQFSFSVIFSHFHFIFISFSITIFALFSIDIFSIF